MYPYLALPGTMKLVENKIQYLNNCTKKNIVIPSMFCKECPTTNQHWCGRCVVFMNCLLFKPVYEHWLVGWLITLYQSPFFFASVLLHSYSILLPLCMSKPKLCWLNHFRSLNLLGMFLLQNRLKSDSDFFSQLVAFERPKSPRIRFILGLKSYPWRIRLVLIYIYIC